MNDEVVTVVTENEAFKGVMQEYLTKALAWVESGAAFLEKEIPIYVVELGKWWTFTHSIYAVVGILLTVIGLICLKRTLKKYDNLNEEDPKDVITVLLTFVGIGVGVPVFFYNLVQAIKPIIAPRVFLIDYLTDLLGKM